MKKSFLLAFVIIGSCIWARAADPDDSKPTEKKIIVTTVKEAHKLPASTASKAPEAKGESYNITVFDAADGTPKRVNVNTATDKAIKFLIAANAEAAQPTPFKDKIVRIQAAAGNRSEIFTLENVKLVSLLGNEFITGTAVKYRNDRFSGLEVYLNLRDVLTIVAMTPEQAKKFNEMQPRRGPYNPPQGNQGPYNPPQGNQGPYNPPQGNQGPYNPPQGGQGPYNPPQGGQGPYNPPQGGQGPYNPPQGGQGPYNPPQGPYNPPQGPYNPPQGNQGPHNPPQGGQGPYNPLQGPYNPPQGGQGPYNPPQGNQGQNNPPQANQGQNNPPPGGRSTP
jgi:hypothetical protein